MSDAQLISASRWSVALALAGFWAVHLIALISAPG